MSIRDLIPWSRQENKVPAQVSAAGAASDPVLSLHREVNRLFEDFFRGFGVPALAGVERGSSPRASNLPKPTRKSESRPNSPDSTKRTWK
jgi:hypothetical protein